MKFSCIELTCNPNHAQIRACSSTRKVTNGTENEIYSEENFHIWICKGLTPVCSLYLRAWFQLGFICFTFTCKTTAHIGIFNYSVGHKYSLLSASIFQFDIFLPPFCSTLIISSNSDLYSVAVTAGILNIIPVCANCIQISIRFVPLLFASLSLVSIWIWVWFVPLCRTTAHITLALQWYLQYRHISVWSFPLCSPLSIISNDDLHSVSTT